MARVQTKQQLIDRVAELEQEVEDLQGKLDQIADVIGGYDDMYDDPGEDEGDEEDDGSEEDES